MKRFRIALLQKLGFNVIDAEKGKALELYQKNAADVTLAVTDNISSGFGEGDISSKIPREEIAGFINKPYNFDQLRGVLKLEVG